MSAAIAFDDVAQALAAGGSVVHAAEAHGCLVGALCARRVYLPAEWLEELLPDGPEAGAAPPDLDAGPLRMLFDQSRRVLEADELEFQPLLPSDEAALAERVEALGAWLQGFLYGVGAAGPFKRGAVPATVTEVLADFAEVSRAGAVGSDDTEVEESALVDLVEFLRAGVLLVYEEFADLRAAQPASTVRH
jgi:uncharacterized protein YgfB (UPF0149 family)